MTDNSDRNKGESAIIIENLNRQITDLKRQLNSASLQMEMMRAQMDDLRVQARQAVSVERFAVPDEPHMNEINETVDMIWKAVQKDRKKNRSAMDTDESTPPQKIDERLILIVLKLRRRGCTVREIAGHVGLGVGTVHGILKRYMNDPDMQKLITGGTQMELSDYLMIHPDDT